MKIFILDNFDSFTYNLAHMVEPFASDVCVRRNDEINLEEINPFDKIIFSPGPGLPSEVKIMFDIINHFKGIKPILGVCLGHQAIAEYFGGKLTNLPEVNHGREFETLIIKQDYIFEGIPEVFISARYHSWIVDSKNFPNELEITSTDLKNNHIMSLKHNKYDIRGVQFHPESIMTKFGLKMLENWIKH